jgi:hypothetical protein
VGSQSFSARLLLFFIKRKGFLDLIFIKETLSSPMTKIFFLGEFLILFIESTNFSTNLKIILIYFLYFYNKK